MCAVQVAQLEKDLDRRAASLREAEQQAQGLVQQAQTEANAAKTTVETAANNLKAQAQRYEEARKEREEAWEASHYEEHGHGTV